jgi:hypothetical protein
MCSELRAARVNALGSRVSRPHAQAAQSVPHTEIDPRGRAFVIAMVKLLIVGFFAACAGEPAPTQAPTPVSVAVCPSDIATLVGKPCSPAQTCGSASGTGFSNVVVCRGGTWQQVEVPPPP